MFTVRDCVDVIAAETGTPEEIIGTGGGTRSEFCNQMKADCLGIPFQVMKTENATGIGAGVIAGAAEGVFSTPEEAVAGYLEKGKLYLPDPAKKAAYDEAYGKYLELQKGCQPLFDRNL